MSKTEPKDTPLECVIENDQLIIRIGINTLAWAADNSPALEVFDIESGDYKRLTTVSNAEEFASEVVRHLQDEQEDGTTPVHLLLDKTFLAAYEDGSEGLTYP